MYTNINMVVPFENDKSIKRDFSYSKVIILIKILNFNKKNIDPNKTEDDPKKIKTQMSELAKSIGYSQSGLDEIKDYLEKIKIIRKKEVDGSNKKIEIDRSRLKHFIDEQDILAWLEKNFLNKYNTYKYNNYW